MEGECRIAPRAPNTVSTTGINQVTFLTLYFRELKARDFFADNKSVEPPILWPLEVMVHPLELRFKYHFSGDKPTNRLDKVCERLLLCVEHDYADGIFSRSSLWLTSRT